MSNYAGRIISVSGPLVTADNMRGASIQEICHVGKQKLIGEIIEINEDIASVQVYEETAGLSYGDPLASLGEPLSVELGPGIMSAIFDGIQRPLYGYLEVTQSNYLKRGINIPALDRERLWAFTPTVDIGRTVHPGDVIGTVPETQSVLHKIMVPHGISGQVTAIEAGHFTVDSVVCKLLSPSGKEHALTLMQKWPVRTPRPIAEKISPERPVVTGQRIIDTFFPVLKGGTAAVPGPFGAGKTIVQHQIAKWADVDIVVYIGCGERGNEMTDVMNEFPRLVDPKTGNSLMQRTVLIANTSNMPVAAREASIYTGITIAEYYRDMGYDIAIMADSTSRWAEALREMSGRLEEMPGDEGYPAYLGSRISNYYERAGNAVTIGDEGRVGSITAISAVSPQGGDISEPVTQNTLRIVKVFWGLDAGLARSRHFPAINWMISYSLHADIANLYYDQFINEDMGDLIKQAFVILQEENRLQEFVRLVGIEAMSDGDRLKLEIAKSLREDYLQQSAFDQVDAFSSLRKQRKILKLIIDYYLESKSLIDKRMLSFGEYYKQTDGIREKIARAKYIPERELDTINGISRDMLGAIASIRRAKERDGGVGYD